MAEITIGGIGLVGLLTLFQTCHGAYNIFIRSAKGLGRDFHLLSIHLEVERQKLQIWGQYLGISHAGQCLALREESFETQEFVVKLLECIKALLDDIDVITVRYGVKIIEDGQSMDERVETALEGLNFDDIRSCAAGKIAQIKRTRTERSVTKSTSRLGKLRWALSDNSKLTKLIDDLRRINENLWVSLPRNQWLKLARGLPSRVLPEISDQAALAAVQGNASNNETTELLAACVDLRRNALLSIANESNVDFGDHLRLPSSQVAVTLEYDTGDPKKRQIACITNANGAKTAALLEWRHVDRSFSFNEKTTIRSRIKALAVLLSSDRQSRFGLLKCIGFFKDDQHLTQTSVERYGLLFEHINVAALQPVPDITSSILTQFRPRSLSEYIDATASQTPYLGDRFRVATALCNTVLQMHASTWLHKAIQSSNIVFFPSKSYGSFADLDISKPFLTGFDFSRPDIPSAHSFEVPKDRTYNDYRHPSLWTRDGTISTPRYQRHHDIYSLGVVLLEIGNWKLVKNLPNSYRDQRNPQLWRDFLLECTNYLGHRCGKVYQEVVKTCLTGRFEERGWTDHETNTEDGILVKESFLFDVVYKLGKCYA